MVRVCWPVFVLLLFLLQTVAEVRTNSEHNLVRKKREWIPPPKQLEENVDYRDREFVAKIHSDFDNGNGNILYSLEGIGASLSPFHVFIVNAKTGLVQVTKVLDREEIDTYKLLGVARYADDGRLAEQKIDIKFKIVDQNDNPPVFGVIRPGQVDELSPAGTPVMTITATDADEKGNKNSQIAYSIVSQTPSDDMFYISNNGTIYVKSDNLDRETVDQYTLIVKGQDLNGGEGGNVATSTVTINIGDVNDNAPTLESELYEGKIEENTQGMEVMRFKAQDKDQKGTDNWEAVYEIVKGNEAGYFSIRTDPNTNEGILMLDKAVDYEDVKNLELGVAVKNKAPLRGGSGTASEFGVLIPGSGGGIGGGIGGGTGGETGWGTGGGIAGGSVGGSAGGAQGATGASTGGSTGTSWQSGSSYKTYPVKINVINQPEGPRFDPKVKAIPISEGSQSFNVNNVIGTYPAIDGDTGKPAQNVKYAKGLDPDNWLTIDPKTAEIRLNKKPDRESKFLKNGTYYAEVLSITEDMPAKTATGTIAIQVEDFNDHCPTMTSNIKTLCTSDDAIIVRAEDGDAFPNGAPFDFEVIPERTQGKWQVEHLNDTAAILRAQETFWPGAYEVEFLVRDQQGQACPEPQKVKVQVCTCENGVVCGNRDGNGQPAKQSKLGPAGIGLLLLGLLLLLLIPLLFFFCLCGTAAALPGGFAELPDDTKSHLINYSTEGQGENTEVPLLNMPTMVDIGGFGAGNGFASKTSLGGTMQKSMVSINGTHQVLCPDGATDYAEGTMRKNWRDSGFHHEFESGGEIYDGMALDENFLRQYYTQKAASGGENGVGNALLVYDYEGQGSPAGSVGCCSLLESNDDLQFLDNLGPKFKTLAEVCGGKTIPTEVKQVSAPMPNTFINNQTTVTSFENVPKPPSPPKLQPAVTKTEQTVVKETSQRSQVVKESKATVNGGMTKVKQGMANQGQMLLLQQQQQQPVYYTTTPVMQPVQYVVQPQVQNTVMLAEAPTNNLQGMLLVNATQAGPAQGMVIQGQAQAPGMVLMERSFQGVATNLIQAGNLSGSQTVLVPAATLTKVKGSQTGLVQGGTLQPGGLSGSQSFLVVGGPTNSEGQLVQELGGLSQMRDISGSQKVLYNIGGTLSSANGMVGSSTTTVNTLPTYHKMVVEKTTEIH